MACCTNGLDELFSEPVARHDANRYRKHGLSKRARKLIAAIQSVVIIEGKRVLEVGVGVGAVTIELLRKGAASATGVDAATSQLEQARILAAEKGVADRLDLVLADFARAEHIGHADIVLLDRVVCCYPDWKRLLALAAERADHALVMTYPRDVWYMRVAWAAMNVWQTLVRRDFRLYMHPASEMRELLAQYGLQPKVVGRYFGWEIMTAHR